MPLALMGDEGSKKQVLNPNEDPLPTNVNQNSAFDSNGIPLSGPATITGGIVLYDGADANGDPIPAVLCTSPNTPPGCIDLTGIQIQLLDPNGNVVATTSPNYDGTYTFNIDNLPNNNYQVFIPKAGGISSAYVNFNFTYDPSTSGPNQVNVSNLVTYTYSFESGAAIVSGSATTPGYVDANGTTVLNPGPLPSGTPVKLYKEDPNGNITLSAYPGKTFSLIASTTLTLSGGVSSYSFNRTNPADYLQEGAKYVVEVQGSQVIDNGRPFKDTYTSFTFNYNASKTDNSVAALVNVPSVSCEWDPATSAPANISGQVTNSAFPSADKSGFTVTLKDGAGNVIATTTTNVSGNYSFTGVNLSNGTYSIEVTKDKFNSKSTAFTYVANPNGSTQSVSIATVGMLAKDAKVTGEIKDTSNNPVPNAVISFRPASTLSAADLNYILADPNIPNEIKALTQKWQQEKIAYGSFQTWATKSYEKEYNCSDGSKTIILTDGKLGCAPGTTATTPTGKLVMTVLAGSWDYFVSAAGFEPTSVGTETFDGVDKNVNPPLMSPSVKRSIINGYAVLLDTTTDGTKRYYANNNIPSLNGQGYTKTTDGLANLIAVLLNNKNNSGQQVAHLTLTDDTGKYEFTNLHVVLPSSLVTDSDRVAYAVSEYQKYLANPASCSCAVVTDKSTISSDLNPNAASLYEMGSQFYFKQGTYNAFIVDPKQHSSVSSTTINNSSVAGTPGVDLDSADQTLATSLVPHLPRRNITGTVSDAITTGAVSGATIRLCTSIASNGSCNFARMDVVPITDVLKVNGGRLSPTADQQVPEVTTDANGNYTISNINPGNYIIQVIKGGYVTGTMPITVPSTSDGLTSGHTLSGVNPKIVQDGPRGNITGLVKKAIPGNPVLQDFNENYTIELVHPNTGMRPTSGVNPMTMASGPANYNNTRYYVYNVNPAEWKINFNATNYKPITGLVTVQPSGTVSFDIVTMIPSNTPPANITGRTLNAMVAGQPIAGLTVRLRWGVNVTSGPYAVDVNGNTIPPVTTNSTGSFVIPNVPAGNYTLEVSGTATSPISFGQAATTYRTVISAGTSTPTNQDILVAPQLNSTEVRIVLSWNAVPKDLDSHFEFGSAVPAQANWNQPNRFCNNATIENMKAIVPQNPPPTGYDTEGKPLTRPDICNLTLDVDVITGFGPETVTVKNTIVGAGNPWTAPRRGYTIYNWSKARKKDTTLNIADSGAIVRVFKSQGLVRTYNAGPTEIGDWWNVFCLDGNRNIIDIGSGTCTNSSFFNAYKN